MPIEIPGISDADLDTALANIAVLPKNEQIQLLVQSLQNITGTVRYYTLDGTEKFMKLEGILNFFTHA